MQQSEKVKPYEPFVLCKYSFCAFGYTFFMLMVHSLQTLMRKHSVYVYVFFSFSYTSIVCFHMCNSFYANYFENYLSY